jgi:NitT/TauT family transport system permease protein
VKRPAPEPKTARAPRAGHWRAPILRSTYPVAALLVAAVVWDLAIRLFEIKPFILPPPLAVLEALVRDFPSLMRDSWVTLQEVLAGFALGLVVGLAAALAIVSWPLAERTLYPLIVASQAVPKIAIAPLFILWLGFGIAPKIFVAFMIAFFPIVIATIVGLRSIGMETIYLARSMGASARQMFFKFRLPHAMPSIFGGLKVAMTLSVTGAVVGEFIGTDHGLGRVIILANGNLDTAVLFAAVAILGVMGLALFLAVDIVERVVVRWHISQRSVQLGSL